MDGYLQLLLQDLWETWLPQDEKRKDD